MGGANQFLETREMIVFPLERLHIIFLRTSYLLVCEYVCESVDTRYMHAWCMHGGQKTAYRSSFSLPTLRASGIKPKVLKFSAGVHLAH